MKAKYNLGVVKEPSFPTPASPNQGRGIALSTHILKFLEGDEENKD